MNVLIACEESQTVRGMTADVAAEAMLAMIAALRQIRDIDKGAYKAVRAWIKDGHLIEKGEKDD